MLMRMYLSLSHFFLSAKLRFGHFEFDGEFGLSKVQLFFKKHDRDVILKEMDQIFCYQSNCGKEIPRF